MKNFFRHIGQTEIRNALAVVYIIAVLGFVYVLAFKPIPVENKDLVNVLGGTVIGGSGLILAFYFGASKKEVDKNENHEYKI